MANKKIGITGHNGFLGTHLKNQIRYKFKEFKIINFKRSFFDNENDLSTFINSCDVIFHLAGLNRHKSSEEIVKTNVKLAETLGSNLIKNKFKGSLIFSSSTQEYEDTPYGKSKKKAAEILIEASKSVNFSFVKLIIPNIFGPFCKPYYNSFITTFSHQLIKEEKIEIIQNVQVPLIYIDEVIDQLLNVLELKGINKIKVLHKKEIKVDEVLSKLEEFHKAYIENGDIPKLDSIFDIQLFNTFRSAINSKEFFPIPYKTHKDERGCFSELVRSYTKGQVSFSTTKPGVTRGNHFHTRKIERFSVIQGEAMIAFRTIGDEEIIEFKLSGKEPSYVDIPILTTHNIVNIGSEDLITVFWINEHYNLNDADVYFEKV